MKEVSGVRRNYIDEINKDGYMLVKKENNEKQQENIDILYDYFKTPHDKAFKARFETYKQGYKSARRKIIFSNMSSFLFWGRSIL